MDTTPPTHTFTDTLKHVPTDRLYPNPWQTRLADDPAHVASLAEDILANGLLQPPLARPDPANHGYYELAFGHSRFAAPPAASAARCRWCGGPAHSSLMDCPAVTAALEPVSPSRTTRRAVKPKAASQVYNTIRRRPAAHSKPAPRPEPRQRSFAVRSCAHCGEPMERTGGRQKYHPQCYADANREANRERARARRSTLPARPATVVPCSGCGQPVERKCNRQKYCAACAAAAAREQRREYKRAHRVHQNHSQ